jgi:hypothetical protein
MPSTRVLRTFTAATFGHVCIILALMVVPSLGGTDPPATLCSSTALRSRESGALPHLPWYFRFDFGEIVAVVGAIRHYYARPTISAAVLRTTNLMPAQRHCGLVPFVLRLLLRRNVGNVHFFFRFFIGVILQRRIQVPCT